MPIEIPEIELNLERFKQPFTFVSRPTPVSGDYRPLWRIALVLIILQYSRGKKASLPKLHLLNWAIRSHEGRSRLKGYFQGKIRKEEVAVRVDPSLNRAIDYSAGERLVEVLRGKSLKLTEKGSSLVSQVESDIFCLKDEKSFLKDMQPFLTEANVRDLLNLPK